MVDSPAQQSQPSTQTPPRVTEVFRGQQPAPRVAPVPEQPQVPQPQTVPSQPTNDQSLPTSQQPQPEAQSPPQQEQADQPPVQQPADQYPEEYYQYPELFPGLAKPIPEEIIYEWKAPSRPFKQHNRQYYTTVGTIVLLISLILFFAGQWLPIAVVIAVAFLSYVMSSIPPHTVTIQLSNYGVRLEKELYYWEELGWFWFKEKHGEEVLYVETVRFPNRLALMVGEAQKETLRLIFSEVLLEQEPPPTYFEKAAAWLQEKIPLDIES